MSLKFYDNNNDRDIEMIDSTNESFSFPFIDSNQKYKIKRSYQKMINNYGEKDLIKRRENYQLFLEYKKKMEEKFKGQINKLISEEENEKDIQNRKSLIYKDREYDEENEKKWVETYYKLKNEELRKAVFGL